CVLHTGLRAPSCHSKFETNPLTFCHLENLSWAWFTEICSKPFEEWSSALTPVARAPLSPGISPRPTAFTPTRNKASFRPTKARQVLHIIQSCGHLLRIRAPFHVHPVLAPFHPVISPCPFTRALL
ncbi:unnamed protein product, partial [Ectocarpus sp. 12 AP-2014]